MLPGSIQFTDTVEVHVHLSRLARIEEDPKRYSNIALKTFTAESIRLLNGYRKDIAALNHQVTGLTAELDAYRDVTLWRCFLKWYKDRRALLEY
jgi:hypothetical protein